MKPNRSRTHTRRKRTIIVTLAVVLLLLGFFWLRTATIEAPQAPRQNNTKQEATEGDDEPDTPPRINLQPTVESWVERQSGNYGIVVYDPANKEIIASHQPDEQYFTASIYKLYVAYLTLMDFQSGAADPNEVVLAGQTRKECVYKMIHSSDSPCGETVLNAMGGETLTNRLSETFGFTGTAFPAFLTTAGDTNALLVRLQAKQDLNDDNTAFLLDAMRTQIYRSGLPAGMPNAEVADKVGFDSPDLWIDTGIVTLPNDRQYLVTIYGNGGVGSAQIADFGRTIFEELNQ